MNPQQVIEGNVGKYLVHGRSYPQPLPEELIQWYCYTSDGGHSIMAALESHYSPGADPAAFLVPAPVKAVIRAGYTISDDGYVVSDLPYNSQRGLVTQPGDAEY